MKLKVLAVAASLVAASPSYAQITTSMSAPSPNFTTANPVAAGAYSVLSYYATFEDTSSNSRFSPDVFYSSTSVGGYNVAPTGDTTQYAFVAPIPQTGSPNSPAVFDTTGLGAFNRVSLLWGSMDSFNSITFLAGAATVASFTGSSFNTPADNGQNTRYVTFNIDPSAVGTITGIEFRSTGLNAFEFDNLALGVSAAVPEASTWAMMIAGFGVAGGMLRRRTKQTGNVTLARA